MARDEAAAALEFERAAEEQTRLDWMQELEEYRFAIEGEGADRSWLIVLPGVGETSRTLQPIARGRVLRRRHVEWVDQGWRGAVEDACYAVRVAEIRAPRVLSPRDSVPSIMIGRWLEDGCPDGLAIDLTDSDSEAAIERLHVAF